MDRIEEDDWKSKMLDIPRLEQLLSRIHNLNKADASVAESEIMKAFKILLNSYNIRRKGGVDFSDAFKIWDQYQSCTACDGEGVVGVRGRKSLCPDCEPLRHKYSEAVRVATQRNY